MTAALTLHLSSIAALAAPASLLGSTSQCKAAAVMVGFETACGANPPIGHSLPQAGSHQAAAFVTYIVRNCSIGFLGIILSTRILSLHPGG
jgi:hypothetical protein